VSWLGKLFQGGSWGLDLGASCLKACRVDGVKLAGLACEALPASELGTFCKNHHLKGARVVFSAPPSGLDATRLIEVPTMTPEELVEQIVWEAEAVLPFGIEGLLLCHQVVARPDESRMQVLLCSTDRAPVLERAQKLREAGLEPVRAVPPMLAAAAWLSATQPMLVRPPIALLDVGAARTGWGVLEHGHLRSALTFAGGGDLIVEAVRQARSVRAAAGAPEPYRGGDLTAVAQAATESACERLAALLPPTVPNRIRRLLLTGSTAREPLLVPALEKRSGLAISVWDPLDGVAIGKVDEAALREHRLGLAVALGLALDGHGFELPR
jgi:type IV pilus assembly protein PilM